MRNVDVMIVDLDDPMAQAIAWEEIGDALSGTERQRADALLNPVERTRFYLAHFALRRLLAARHHVPLDCNFHKSRHGKPYLHGGPPFSFSHSHSIAIVAITDEGAVGVDVEQIRAVETPVDWRIRYPALGGRVLNVPGEANLDTSVMFLRAWTRLEALAKCDDIPMSILLSLSIPYTGSPSSTHDLNVGGGYIAALAVQGHQNIIVSRAEWDELYSIRVKKRAPEDPCEPAP
jgi:phosphopantetheinyl transferase